MPCHPPPLLLQAELNPVHSQAYVYPQLAHLTFLMRKLLQMVS